MPSVCPSCGTHNLDGADECADCGGDLRTVDLPQPSSPLEETVMLLPLTALKVAPVHAVGPDTSIDAAVHTLCRQKIDLLGVVENDRLIGVLSVRDILTRIGSDYSSKLSLSVRQFMTASPESLPPDAPIAFAINKMDVGGYRHVPVLQGHRLVGVVSSKDLIRHLVKYSRGARARMSKSA